MGEGQGKHVWIFPDGDLPPAREPPGVLPWPGSLAVE